MKKYLHFILLSLPFICLGQIDPHLSQIELAPLQLNPALAGITIKGDAKQRFYANYRSQWGNFIEPGAGFSTANIGLDGAICMSHNNNYWGIGGNILADEVGQLSQSLVAANLVTSYGLKLSDGRNSGLYVAGGARLGIQHYRINLDDLQFNEQFDRGYFRDFKSNGEAFPTTGNLKKFLPDFGVGIVLFSNQRSFNDAAFSIGLSIDHLSQPNLNLLDQNNHTPVVLRRKWTIHAGATLPFGSNTHSKKRIAINPRVLIYMQQPAFEMQFGADMIFIFDKTGNKEALLKIGIFDRIVGGLDQYPLTSDALIGRLGFEINDLQFGIAYDINISKLVSASKTYGAIELAFGFVFGDRSRTCAPVCHF